MTIDDLMEKCPKCEGTGLLINVQPKGKVDINQPGPKCHTRETCENCHGSKWIAKPAGQAILQFLRQFPR